VHVIASQTARFPDSSVRQAPRVISGLAELVSFVVENHCRIPEADDVVHLVNMEGPAHAVP